MHAAAKVCWDRSLDSEVVGVGQLQVTRLPQRPGVYAPTLLDRLPTILFRACNVRHAQESSGSRNDLLGLWVPMVALMTAGGRPSPPAKTM